MQSQKQELPPEGQISIIGYDGNDPSYPILGVVRNPKIGLGMTTPAIGTLIGDSRYPNHGFVELRVTHPGVRVLWVYQVLGGTTLKTNAADPSAHGVGTVTTEQIVPAGTAADDLSLTTLESSVELVDKSRSKKRKKTLADGVSWPTLYNYTVDEITTIVMEMKMTVVSSTEASNAGLINGWFTSYEADKTDHTKAIKIERKPYGDPPSDLVWYGTVPADLRDTLNSITPIWGKSEGGGNGTGEGTKYSASASASIAPSGAPYSDIRYGYQGATRARFTRKYLFSPPVESDIPEPTVIRPSYGTITVMSKGGSQSTNINASTDGSSQSIDQSSHITTQVHHIGPVLTSGISRTDTYSPDDVSYYASAGLVSAAATAHGEVKMSINIAASSPTAYTAGNYILHSAKATQMEAGVWMLDIIEYKIPTGA